MKVQVHVYTSKLERVTVRVFRSLHAAFAFIARVERRNPRHIATIHQVTR